MLTEQQLKERRKYVTGTDASTILGVNPYDTVFDVWQRKLGLADEKDLSGNPRVEAGTYLEPAIRQMFRDKAGKLVTEPEEIIIHPAHKWMAGSLDGLVPEENAILEIKTAGFEDGWGDQGVNIIPKHYLCQVAHYMAVCDASYAYVAVLIGGWDFRYYKIDRSLKLEEKLVEKEYEFWHKNVLAQEPPEPRNYDDVVSLCRNKTIENPITSNTEIEEVIRGLKEVKHKTKRLQEAEKNLKNKIALYMRQHETLISHNGEILLTWKQAKDSARFDSKKFTKEYPDLANKFVNLSPGSRRLLIKGESSD